MSSKTLKGYIEKKLSGRSSLQAYADNLWYLACVDDGEYKTASGKVKSDCRPYKYQLKPRSQLADKTTNCPNPIGHYIIEDDDKIKRIDIPCKSWRCPACSRVKKNIVLDRCRDGFVGERVRFLTLTLSEEAEDDKITKYWNRFKAALRKKGYCHFKFFWVKEFTKQGIRHLHVAISAYIPKALIDHYWTLATEKTSFITYISYNEFLKNPAGYMTKYMTKQLNESDLYEKGERRFGFSRHQAFKNCKKSYSSMYAILRTDIRIEFGSHFNQASKYWQEIYDKYIGLAGVHALNYLEAKTIPSSGLKMVLDGNQYYARELINILVKDVPTFYGFVPMDEQKWRDWLL